MAIVTYFRSSSFNAWEFCPHQWFMSYVLGVKDPGNHKAEKGSITHKALELLARKKLAIQNGEGTFKDEELGKEFDTASFAPEEAANLAIDYYVPKSIHTYKRADIRDCRQWMYDAMTWSGGMFNPLNRDIIWPEKYFDFVLDHEWARYSFELPDGQKLEGQLALKGTMDLTVRVDGHPDTIELIDWKTGRRIDWGTGEEKTWKKLRDDPQLRLYHYALSREFPEAKHIIVTIVFIRDGGPFCLDFSKDDLAVTERMIRERFETIKECSRPKLNKSWRCKSFCFYGKNNFPGTQKTICEHLSKELLTLGIDKVVTKHGNVNTLTKYGSGGGVTNRDGAS